MDTTATQKMRPYVIVVYEVSVVFLLLIAVTPDGKGLSDVLRNPLGTLQVNNTTLVLLLAAFLPVIAPQLRKLKMFGAEIELAEKVEQVSRDVKEVRETSARNQHKTEAALFTIATSLSSRILTATERRAGEGLESSGFELGQLDFLESWIVSRIVHERLAQHAHECPDRFAIKPLLAPEPTIVPFFKLLTGQIDMFVWYSGTGMMLAGRSFDQAQSNDEQSVREALNKVYHPAGLTWLPSLGFQNSEFLVMTAQKAGELGIQNVTDLKDRAGELTFAAPREFFLRDWSFPRLERNGVRFKHIIDDLSLNDRINGLLAGRFDVGLIFETDPLFKSSQLTPIESDTVIYPRLPQYVMPLCRRDLVGVDIGNGQTVESLLSSVRISQQEMRSMIAHAEAENVTIGHTLALAGMTSLYQQRRAPSDSR